jgi:hypothetical protein
MHIGEHHYARFLKKFNHTHIARLEIIIIVEREKGENDEKIKTMDGISRGSGDGLYGPSSCTG